MKVILLDYVYKHGVAGEVIDVADGFARNFLIPRRLAVKATEGEMRRASKLREQAVASRAALEDRLNELARVIDGVELVFGRRAAPTGKLFGSVTTQEIAEALNAKTSVDINRRRISQQPLREIGTHAVPVRLGTEFSPVLQIIIVREEELADYLAGKRPPAPAATVDETAASADETVEAQPDSAPEASIEPVAEFARETPEIPETEGDAGGEAAE